jgi:NTE family protein
MIASTSTLVAPPGRIAAGGLLIDVETQLLSSLPEPALEQVRRAAQTRYFLPGDAALREGETPAELFIIVRGEAVVFGRDWHGERHVLAQLGPGECFGELSMLSGEPASATVEALSELEVWVLPQNDVSAIAAEHPALARNLAGMLAERLRKSNERALNAQRGRLVVILAPGKAPCAAPASRLLARSIAWHTRQPIVYIDTITPPDERDGAGIADDHLEILAGRDGTGFEGEQLSTIEEAQGRARFVLVLSHLASALRDGILRRADSVLVIADESEMAELASLLEDCPTRSDAALRVVIVRDRPHSPTTGELRTLQERAPARWQVQGIIPGGVAILRTNPSPDSPTGKAIARQARKTAGLAVGLALGAGGAKGYAHIGVVRALQEAGVPFDSVTGCSIGAPLAAGVAAEWTLDEIRGALDAVSAKAMRPNVPVVSILTSRSIRAELRSVTNDIRFDELPTPLGIVAVDIEHGESILLRHGRVWPAMVASMAYPGIYEPVRMGSRHLVDGGVLNPVPVSGAVALGADIVISSVLSGRPDGAVRSGSGEPPRQRMILESITRSLEIMQSKITEESFTRADVAIHPRFESPPGLLDFRKGRTLEHLGEEAVERALPKLRSVLPWLA